MKNRLTIKNNITICLLIFVSSLYSLNAASIQQIQPNGMTRILENMFLAFAALIIVAVIAFLYRFVFLLLEVQKLRLMQEQGLEIPKPETTESLFSRLYNWAVGLVPVSQEASIMLDHDYDGIKELDNDLPPWWVAMFYIGIFAGAGYFLYYHYFDAGLSSHEAYALEMKYAEAAQARFLDKQANLVNEANVEALLDEASLAGGAAIFKASCAACHGQLGEGLVGPNMTDDYWIHGGDIKSVFKTIKYGVPQKGMIAWKTQMNAASMHQVASYIMTLKGTNPPNQKEKQGTLYTEEK